MFDRFSEDAKRALFFARCAVSEYGGTAIGDAHLLLGVVKAAPTVVSQFVEHEGAVQALAECLSARFAGPDLLAASVEIPFDTLAVQILRQAAEAADRFGHRSITPEHLLLALLGEDASGAAACLRHIGVERNAIVQALTSDAGT